MTVAPFSEATTKHVRFHLHAGQSKAIYSTARIIAVIAGRQSGKTVTGPPWLFNEMRARGPGDYLIASPSFQLLAKKALPEFERLFIKQLRLGKFVGRDHHFEVSKQGCDALWGEVPSETTKIFFGHADMPETLESATAKAAWLDECGQRRFHLESYEAIRGRLAVCRGRCLMTTTPYSQNWLKSQIWDKAGLIHRWDDNLKLTESRYPEKEADIHVISFNSLLNPTFPRDEFESMVRSLPQWKMDLFYRGKFTRPAGVIYDCFDEIVHKCSPFAIPQAWPRYLGMDFGGVHTAGVFLAAELNNNGNETGRLFAYREYPVAGRWAAMTAKVHTESLLMGEVRKPIAVGGAASEDNWRREFTQAGLTIREPPIKEVDVGIDRVYGAIKSNQLFVFDTCVGLLDELASYSRELDENGNVTERIEDKETYHRLDCLRYIISHIKGGKKTLWLR